MRSFWFPPTLVALAVLAVPVERMASGDLGARASAADTAPRFGLERCYGVARAGRDDCQSVARRCAGGSRRDGQGDAWIWLPAGLCERLVGGSLTPFRQASAALPPAAGGSVP